MKLKSTLTGLLGLAIAFALTGCSLPFQAHAALDQHRQLWMSKGIQDYSYTLTTWAVLSNEEILCPVVVRDGVLSPAGAGCGYTMEELFSIGEENLAKGASILSEKRVEIEYDDQYGFPTSICTGHKDIPDSFGCYWISDFVVND